MDLLPLELYSSIFCTLSRQDLVSLCRVSHSFVGEAQRCLHVSIDPRDSISFFGWVRAVQHNPALALYPRRLAVYLPWQMQDDDAQALADVLPRCIQLTALAFGRDIPSSPFILSSTAVLWRILARCTFPLTAFHDTYSDAAALLRTAPDVRTFFAAHQMLQKLAVPYRLPRHITLPHISTLEILSPLSTTALDSLPIVQTPSKRLTIHLENGWWEDSIRRILERNRAVHTLELVNQFNSINFVAGEAIDVITSEFPRVKTLILRFCRLQLHHDRYDAWWDKLAPILKRASDSGLEVLSMQFPSMTGRPGERTRAQYGLQLAMRRAGFWPLRIWIEFWPSSREEGYDPQRDPESGVGIQLRGEEKRQKQWDN